MLNIQKISDSHTCGACSFWLDDSEVRPIYKISFKYDDSNCTQSFRLCSVCLAEIAEKSRNVLLAEHESTSPVILVLKDFVRKNPDKGGFDIELHRKEEVKLWLLEHSYQCEPSANGDRIHIEYWKTR